MNGKFLKLVALSILFCVTVANAESTTKAEFTNSYNVSRAVELIEDGKYDESVVYLQKEVAEKKNTLLLGQSVLQRLGKIEIDNTRNVLKVSTRK